MVLTLLLGVFDKEHLVYQTNETVANTGVLLVLRLGGEVVGYSALCFETGLEVISAASGRFEVFFLDFGSIRTKEFVEEPVHYARACLRSCSAARRCCKGARG